MSSSPSVRGVVAVLAAIAVAAGCTGSNDDATFATSFSVEGALTELPQLRDSDDAFTIEAVDFVAASEAVGISPLTSDASNDAVMEWAISVRNSETVADGGNGLALSFPQVIGARGVAVPDALPDEFGWPFGSLTHYAEVSRLPDRFSVLAGDVSWSDDLPEVEPGVATIGEGDDGEVGRDTTEIRPLGRPLRVTERDGLAAASLTTSTAADWSAGTHDSFAELTGVVDAARALDDRNAFQAVLVCSSFFSVSAALLENDPQNAEALLERVVDQPFSTLALGVAHTDGRLQSVVVYVFFTEESASTAAPQLQQIWTEGTSAFTDQPFTTLIEGATVQTDGRLVIVSGAAPDTAPGFATYRALNQGELPFVHR